MCTDGGREKLGKGEVTRQHGTAVKTNGMLVGWAFVTEDCGDSGVLSNCLRQLWQNGWRSEPEGREAVEVPLGLR